MLISILYIKVKLNLINDNKYIAFIKNYTKNFDKKKIIKFIIKIHIITISI